MLSFDKAAAVFAKKGYEFYDNNKPYNLNIIGIRTGLQNDDRFDDLFACLYRDENLKEQCLWTTCTTKAGLYYLEHPMNPDGTGILKEGQYKHSHSIGKHHNEYEALVQVGNLTVYRDKNRDKVYNLDPSTLQTANDFHLNIHHANPTQVSVQNWNWSAACQVLNNPNDFAKLMQLAHKSAALYGNSFTYTLLNSSDIA